MGSDSDATAADEPGRRTARAQSSPCRHHEGVDERDEERPPEHPGTTTPQEPDADVPNAPADPQDPPADPDEPLNPA